MRRGLTGAAYLSRLSGAPIIPLAIYGQERISVGRILSRAPVRIRIGAPIPVPQGDATPQQLQAHTDRVMIEIARMLPREYRGVYAADVDGNNAMAEDAPRETV